MLPMLRVEIRPTRAGVYTWVWKLGGVTLGRVRADPFCSSTVLIIGDLHTKAREDLYTKGGDTEAACARQVPYGN